MRISSKQYGRWASIEITNIDIIRIYSPEQVFMILYEEKKKERKKEKKSLIFCNINIFHNALV